MMAELLTWVVETGSPRVAETSTSEEVVRLADRPSAWSIFVTFSARTSVTRRPPKKLPRPMATATLVNRMA